MEEGKSASESVGWEGRVMRWAVLMPCTKQTHGAVDVTHTLPKYNSSSGTPIVKLGQVAAQGLEPWTSCLRSSLLALTVHWSSPCVCTRCGQLPRDGRLLLLQYTRPRNIDPYAQLKGFKRFTSQARDAAHATPLTPLTATPPSLLLHPHCCFNSQAGEEPSARAARAASAVKFIVFSRARSASTTFITVCALGIPTHESCRRASTPSIVKADREWHVRISS